MVRTNTDYIQWLSLVKPTLKVAPVGGDCSLVARTNKCGWAIRGMKGNKLHVLVCSTFIDCKNIVL